MGSYQGKKQCSMGPGWPITTRTEKTSGKELGEEGKQKKFWLSFESCQTPYTKGISVLTFFKSIKVLELK